MSQSSAADLCEQGQELLMRMEYLKAESLLVQAEHQAFASRDWDLLARLYMPLQETRRQRRQRCGEGIVCLDLLAESAADKIEPRHIVEHYPHGQLLVGGWGSIAPAIGVRDLAARRQLYVETFLAAVYPTDSERTTVIVPTPDSPLPQLQPMSLDQLRAQLPPRCIVLSDHELPSGPRKGTYETYGEMMSLWERLHAPFLAAADATSDPLQRIEGYRRTIEVDYACELAHQKLSDVAKMLARG
jgi:hypothetical protein